MRGGPGGHRRGGHNWRKATRLQCWCFEIDW